MNPQHLPERNGSVEFLHSGSARSCDVAYQAQRAAALCPSSEQQTSPVATTLSSRAHDAFRTQLPHGPGGGGSIPDDQRAVLRKHCETSSAEPLQATEQNNQTESERRSNNTLNHCGNNVADMTWWDSRKPTRAMRAPFLPVDRPNQPKFPKRISGTLDFQTAYDMLCDSNFNPGSRPAFLPHKHSELCSRVYGTVFKEDTRIPFPNPGAGRARRCRGWDRWGAKGGRKGTVVLSATAHRIVLCQLCACFI